MQDTPILNPSLASTNKRCLYCGNNQTSHAMSWFNQSLEVCMMPIEKKFVGTAGYRFLDKFGTLLVMPFFYLLRAIGVIRYNGIIRKAPSDRGKVLWEDAE